MRQSQLATLPSARQSSMDSQNLVITSLAASCPSPPIIMIANGKTKVRTGLTLKHPKKPLHYFSNTPDVCGISLRSYYSSQNNEKTYRYKHLNFRTAISSNPENTENCLIVRQSKMAFYESYNNKKQKLKNLYLSFSRTPFNKVKSLRKPKLEKIPIHEALKNREWVLLARPKILNDIHKEICMSNGVEINSNEDNFIAYKYFVGLGNNAKLIKQCFSQRWWWSKVPLTESSLANLYWTQWRDQEFLDKLPSLSKKAPEVEGLPKNRKKNEIIYSARNSGGVNQKMLVDLTALGYGKITNSPSYACININAYLNSADLQMHNKIDFNFLLANKKALFYNLKQYFSAINDDLFEYIPLTFHIKDEFDSEFSNFIECFKKQKKESLWIIKPGENSNRGNGISVVNSLESIKNELKARSVNGNHTFIIQKYIENPFLINKRKFDIRCYTLVTSINGILQCYFYEEGYLRTSSVKYSTLDISDLYIHLTNDAVQKKSENYGKFESGNKLVYSEFQKYLDLIGKQVNFVDEILPKMKKIVKDTIQSVFLKIDPHKRAHTFEIFGYDFLLDADLKPWLLEVNTNPCLELSCSHLTRIIPAMVDNAFRIAIDPLFPEPHGGMKKNITLMNNKFELIFNSCLDGINFVKRLIKNNSLHLIRDIDISLLDENIAATHLIESDRDDIDI